MNCIKDLIYFDVYEYAGKITRECLDGIKHKTSMDYCIPFTEANKYLEDYFEHLTEKDTFMKFYFVGEEKMNLEKMQQLSSLVKGYENDNPAGRRNALYYVKRGYNMADVLIPFKYLLNNYGSKELYINFIGA